MHTANPLNPPSAILFAGRDAALDPAQCRSALLRLDAQPTDFVPALDCPAGASPAFRRALARAQEYARRSLADGTLKSYASNWRAYLLWCATEGEEPVGPDMDQVVAAHLCWLADGDIDDFDELVLDEHGDPVRSPLKASSIHQRLAAINKACELMDLPRPGASRFVSDVAKGIRRSLGIRPTSQRDPLVLADLRRVLDATREPTPEQLRGIVHVHLLGLPNVSSGQLARLRWADVLIRDHGAEIEMPWGTRTTRPRLEVALPATGCPGCPVDALRKLAVGAAGKDAVFRHDGDGTKSGQPFTADGLAKVQQRLLRPIGRSGTSVRLSLEEIRTAVADLLRPRAIDVRDRSLLLTGFAGAARRSNIAPLRWSDFTLVEKGLIVLLRRSKTDQEGAGFEVYIPFGRRDETCPVKHWKQWRDVVADHIGGDPTRLAPDEAVYVSIDRHGNLGRTDDGRLRQLSLDCIDRVVRDRCLAAGLEGNYGSHSLRAGYITTASDAGVALVDIAKQTGHRSLDVLRAYVRHRDGFAHNPLARLGG